MLVRHTHKAINYAQYPDLESNQDLDLRRVRCDPLHHRDKTTLSQSRRLDSHQHQPVYKTGAFLSRATSAVFKTRARVRGVEPRNAVLEAACPPRSTLVYKTPAGLGPVRVC